jgi:hypothetical protein
MVFRGVSWLREPVDCFRVIKSKLLITCSVLGGELDSCCISKRWHMSHLFRLLVAAGLVAFGILVIAVGMARHSADLLAPFHLFAFVALVVLYIAPSALAVHRNCAAVAWIIALNILFGWTFFGWFIALGWAASGKVAMAHPTLPSPPALQGH